MKVLEESKNSLKIEFEQIDQGFLNLIKAKLWQNKATEMAGFYIEHPEVGKPIFILKTKGADVKKVWNNAIAQLTEQIDKLKEQLKSL